MLEKGPWSGGHVAPDGENIFPHKVESGQSQDIHESREQNVHNGEANDPQNYERV